MSKEQGGVLKAWEATLKKTHAAKKRATYSIFGTISLAHEEENNNNNNNTNNNSENNIDDNDNNDDNESSSTSGTTECYYAEKVLPNGDYYTGQWYDNFPSGRGKYLWNDGCMYVGEWYKGKTMGRGRFSWPSGAVYEGEFKSGYMDGNGTYSAVNGNVYRGQWVMNLKHGHGMKQFAKGDWYEGDWRRGLQEGQGKYQWKATNNYYVGEWKNGAICGRGTFMWENGTRYDGQWEDGVPKGNGTFTWPDGSFYVGNWSKDPAEQNGSYHPSMSSSSSSSSPSASQLDWDPQDVYNVYLADCQICPCEKVSILPSQKKLAMWNSSRHSAEKGRRRLSVDGRASVGNERAAFERMNMWGDGDDSGGGGAPVMDMDAELLGMDQTAAEEGNMNYAASLNKGLPMKVPKVAKRQGETICKGHKNYELMLNLQLGIRHSVGRPGPAASLELKASAFDPKEKIWTRFPPEGSKHTPPHGCSEFKWKDYCPLVFRSLRKLFKVDSADYMLSICGDEALRELSSPGKSGSFFYLTNDDRYMIKTMKKSEVKVLIRMLAAYYNHFRSYENTLIIKFYGLHCVKLPGPAQKKVRFIIMGNLFVSEYAIHRRFDLKGSSLGRITDKPESEIDSNTILKDLDLNFIFKLQKAWFQEFCRQVDRDCELLEQERIMDYSLLVGIHFKDVSSNQEIVPCNAEPSSAEVETEEGPRLSRADMDQLQLDPNKWQHIRLGMNMPARVERTVRKNECELQLVGEPTGEFYEIVLTFGIIDILQDYDISKKLEHAYKSIQYDPTSISAVDPKQYSRRFRDFIFRIFAEDS
ncbi:Phosphatidylinositol 4-phosphate 5-kinase 4 [Linum grandiflorum]